MGDVLTGVVRYLHIFTSIMWVGGLFLWGMLVGPTLARRVPPQAGGPVMRAIVPRMTRYFSLAGILAILSGLWLIDLVFPTESYDFGFRLQQGGYGIAMTLGLLGALVMLGIALLVIMPASKKMLAMAPPAAGAAPPAEMAQLQKRLVVGGSVNMLLGTLVLATMVWAVNVFR